VVACWQVGTPMVGSVLDVGQPSFRGRVVAALRRLLVLSKPFGATHDSSSAPTSKSETPMAEDVFIRAARCPSNALRARETAALSHTEAWFQNRLAQCRTARVRFGGHPRIGAPEKNRHGARHERLSSLQPTVVKMSQPFVSLGPEITRSDALQVMHWLDDEAVIRYLADSRDVAASIGRALSRVHLPILTHVFNHGGRFFMAFDRRDRPVGFVRLVNAPSHCEMVMVIGDQENWGRRLGTSAIHQGMKLAFTEMRVKTLIAKIQPENIRSLKAFLGCGFSHACETPLLTSLSMTAERYRALLGTGMFLGSSEIFITEIDKGRLTELMEEHEASVVDLEYEVARAIVARSENVTADVVTLNSRALVQMDGQSVEVVLVYPDEEDPATGKLSVCSEVGTAILGCKAGDSFAWRVGGRTRHISILQVLYQPEAAGHFHL